MDTKGAQERSGHLKPISLRAGTCVRRNISSMSVNFSSLLKMWRQLNPNQMFKVPSKIDKTKFDQTKIDDHLTSAPSGLSSSPQLVRLQKLRTPPGFSRRITWALIRGGIISDCIRTFFFRFCKTWWSRDDECATPHQWGGKCRRGSRQSGQRGGLGRPVAMQDGIT